jgi:hypothetical protein
MSESHAQGYVRADHLWNFLGHAGLHGTALEAIRRRARSRSPVDGLIPLSELSAVIDDAELEHRFVQSGFGAQQLPSGQCGTCDA